MIIHTESMDSQVTRTQFGCTAVRASLRFMQLLEPEKKDEAFLIPLFMKRIYCGADYSTCALPLSNGIQMRLSKSTYCEKGCYTEVDSAMC